MKQINCNNDLQFGMVLTTKNGSKYVVIADENLHHSVIRLNGDKPGNHNELEVGNGKIAVRGGKPGDNGREVIKVQEFVCQPGGNRFSEALKFITGRPFVAELETIWTAVDPKEVALKAALADAEANAARIRKEIANLR